MLLKFLPYFRGCWLLYAPIFSFISDKDRLIELLVSSHSKIIFKALFDPSDPYQLNMVKNKCFDLGTAMTIWSLLKPDDIFFDIGANCGYLSDIGSQKIGIDGRVIAIEPNPLAFKILTMRGVENITAINKVASQNSKGAFRMHRPFYRQTSGSRFLEDSHGKIKSVSLDDLYKESRKSRVALIKIDTEGAELFVLKGAEQILKEQHPFVIAEVSNYSKHFGYKMDDIYDYMKLFGYRYFYSIHDDTNSISFLEKQEEGQVLFSYKQLEDVDFQKN